MSRELRYCPGVGDRKCGAFLSTFDRDPHPTCARCRGKICTMTLTCDFCAVWSAAQWERFNKKRSYQDRKKHCPSGSVPPAQQTSPHAETSLGVSRPGTSSSSCPLGGQGKQEGSQGAPGVVSGGAPSPPARPRSSERGGSASGLSSRAGGLAPASPSPSGAGEVGAARSLQTLPIEDQGRIRGLGHERVARVDVADVVALAPLPVRGQEVESVDADHRPRRSLLVPARAVSGRGLLTATGLDPWIDTGHAVTGRGLLTATGRAVSVRVPLPAGEGGVTARGQAGDYLAEETGRLARQETQEGVGAVASQPPVVSEAAAAVTPVAGGAALTALGGIAGVTASAAGSWGIACPSTAAAGAATTCETAVTPGGAGVSPAAPAAVPGVSGEQQRKVESRSRGRRSRLSSDGTDRRAKKRARRRSPSPGRSSRCQGRRYRSSSDSSEEDRADVSPPRSRRVHGGAPAGDGSSRAYDR